MRDFFNPDNKFFAFMGKVFDIVMLNFFWLIAFAPMLGFMYLAGTTSGIFAIPMVLSVVVVVPANIALYYSIVKSIRHQRGYASKEFFRAFKMNFRQGAVASFVFVILAILLFVDFSYLVSKIMPQGTDVSIIEFIVQRGVELYGGEEAGPSFLEALIYGYINSIIDVLATGDTMTTIWAGGYIAISIFAMGTFIFFSPILSRFDMKLFNAFKFSFGASIKHLWVTLLSILLWGFLFILILISNGLFVLFGIATCMLIESFMMEKVLKKYVLQVLEEKKASGEIQPSDGTDTEGHEDESRDEWYVE